MTITYNPNNGEFYAVRGKEILAKGIFPPNLDLEEFLNYLISDINAGKHKL
jgi:hypothetical protein